ncbi:Hypothetical predicted protein [Mytilus galloprovincialis]|uniref:C2H2-type domain-containing protein n=1 Tax=Mytilus galloprovincialis TaxID=29158 RepID=A0A8B6BR06_MYTGA|nr:Hypothetical predicted protein [Mytilus galloprovincialis]
MPKRPIRTSAKIAKKNIQELDLRSMMYTCLICYKEYENENLVCHIKEHHAGLESYDCTEDNCSSTFIRRGNLLNYLITIHGVEQELARYKLISAERMTNSINKQYYDDLIDNNNIILGLIKD